MELGRAEIGQGEVGQEEMGQEEMGQAGQGQVEMMQTGVGQAELGQAGQRQVEPRQVGQGQVEMTQTGVGQAELGQGGQRQMEPRQVGQGQVEMKQTGLGLTELGQEEVEHAELGQTEQRQVGQSQVEMKQTGLGHAELEQANLEQTGLERVMMGQLPGQTVMGQTRLEQVDLEHAVLDQPTFGPEKLGQTIQAQDEAKTQNGNCTQDVYVISFDYWIQPPDKDKESDEDEVDYETALKRAGLGRYNLLLLLMLMPATWTSGFNTSSISMVLPIAGCDLQLSTIEKGWLNSAIYLGMVASAFMWGFLSDTYGRQKLLVAGYLLDAVCCVLSALATSFWPLFLFKFLSGLMICGPYSIIMAYMSEVFSHKYRDIVLLFSGVIFAFGSVVQPGLGLMIIPQSFHWDMLGLLELTSWRVYLLVCSLPSLLAGLGAALCVESPKFLLEKGRQQEALFALQSIYAANTGKDKTSYPVKSLLIPAETLQIKNEEESNAFLKKLLKQIFTLFQTPYLFKAVFSSFVMTGAMAALNGIRLFLPEIFSHIADSPSNETETDLLCTILMKPGSPPISCDQISVDSMVYTNMMWIYGVCFAMQCVFNVIARFIKKKYIVVLTTFVPGVSVLLVPHIALQFVVPLAAGYISLLNVYFYAFISHMVLMFPTKLRATSVCAATMFGRLGVLLSNLLIHGLIYSACSFVFYACGVTLIVVAITNLFLPGRDKSEQIQDQSSNSK